ncbi:RNA polymerase sigma-70 factor [Pedobacter metabolipauper]|uniref:RNA polymerase sigma-70 factor (ECF subfamily) n=1 Tax=Pedobacter metabolipauper TaxID=425513 RepID=A0A4R6SRG9_9SPHI|nr:RNA polymerase sigma-70 factor [Pedobacter metabolipauper]TDQ06202.1 RNA polymerase sigma-70 factor (ECF subfamily) [Pedobacter metabolipauper]
MKSFPEYNDHDLGILLRDGAQDAFDEIYRRHWKTLYQSAFNILKDKEPCLDIVQEVFVLLWKNHGNLTEVLSFKAYLLAAVKYRIANYIRHKKVRQDFFDEVQRFKPAPAFLDTTLEVKELKAAIYTFTQNLPERSRMIFQMSRNEHMTNKQIAEELGISEKTVENQITIALRKLRGQLGNNFCWIGFIL